MESYSSRDVVKRSGLSYRQVDYYDRCGLLVPSIEPASGSGSSRRYSADDMRRALVIKTMLDSGLSLQRIRGAIAKAGGSFWAGVADIAYDLRSFQVLVSHLRDELEQAEVSA